jgi:hypothetical protein
MPRIPELRILSLRTSFPRGTGPMGDGGSFPPAPVNSERVKKMRRLLLSVVAAVLLGGFLSGCHHIAGACDCVDDPGWCPPYAGGVIAHKDAAR